MPMRSFSKSFEIHSYLKEMRSNGKKVGFVATMGALHEGHMALIEEAKADSDIVVCSIFVNPQQFNRAEDLNNYPDRINEDVELLLNHKCDILFKPEYDQIYPKEPDLNFDFGSIGMGMEAEYRPNHFEGVAAVISRFFEIIEPEYAYFGEKDFQQLTIIKWLTKLKGFNTEVIGCKTKRFDNGLAMSSRNYLLDTNEFDTASKIYKTMLFAKQNQSQLSPKQITDRCLNMLSEEFQTEYFVIADELTLKPIHSWTDTERPRVFVAAYLGSVRLIDNLSLIN